MTNDQQHGAPEREGVLLRSGDLFASRAQVLVVTVNCVGVMGKGVALEAKLRFPDMFEEYAKLCAANEMRLGEPVLFRRLFPPSLLLFPTKGHWRSVSKLSDIQAGLEYLARHLKAWGITSMAAPPLGCGAGGLEWAVVGPILYDGFARLGIPVELYVPSGVPADEASAAVLRKGVAQADLRRAAETSAPEAVAVVAALGEALKRNPKARVGRILLQKLAFFAQRAGLAVPVTFERATYGPYSDEWQKLVRHMVNNGLLREEQIGGRDAFAYAPGPAFPAYAERLDSELERHRELIEKLARVFARITAEQAELAATALMVSQESTSDSDIVAGVLHWKRRRATPFSEERVRKCLRWLREEGWLRT